MIMFIFRPTALLNRKHRNITHENGDVVALAERGAEVESRWLLVEIRAVDLQVRARGEVDDVRRRVHRRRWD